MYEYVSCYMNGESNEWINDPKVSWRREYWGPTCNSLVFDVHIVCIIDMLEIVCTCTSWNHYMSWYDEIRDGVVWYRNLHCHILHHTPEYSTLHYTLHYSTLHYTLHYSTLHYNTLKHCIHYLSINENSEFCTFCRFDQSVRVEV